MNRVENHLCWIFCGLIAPCFAQPAPPETPSAAAPQFQQSVHAGNLSRLVPNRWGMVGAEIANSSEEAADLVSVLSFGSQPQLQFARRVWIPPHARLSTSIPVRPPSATAANQDQIEIRTLLLNRSGPDDVLVRNSQGEMGSDAILPLVAREPVTAMIGDDDFLGHETVAALRLSRSLTRTISTLTEPLPSSKESLEALSHLVIMSREPLTDSAGLAAIREWLHEGGKIWILLDRVPAQTVADILGDDFTYQPVDRARLMKFTIRGNNVFGLGSEGFSQELSDPVEFVRIVASSGETLHTVNDWPASLLVPRGRGQVLLTTIGVESMLSPSKEPDRQRRGMLYESSYVANEFLTDLAYVLVSRPAPSRALEPAELKDYVSQQIGYQVVDRRIVLSVLGLFCAGLIAAGLWLSQRHQLPQLGWIGPCGAVAAAAMLVVLGQISRSAVPDMVALAQIAEVTENAVDLQLQGVMGVYQQSESTDELGTTEGGVFVPDQAGLSGQTHRLVTTDWGKRHWENLALPAGLQIVPFTYSGTISTPISARATFGPEGLTGTISAGPFRNLSDGVITMPGQRALAVRLEGDEKFQSSTGDVLAPGEFVSGTVLTEEQRRRTAVYRKILSVPVEQSDTRMSQNLPGQRMASGKVYPTKPMLLVWAAPYDLGFQLPETSRRAGSALVAVPLKFDRSPPGTPMTIPAPCITFQSATKSGAYSNADKRWLGPLHSALETPLRFQLPPEILPVQIDRAILTISVNAPRRTLKIIGGDAAQPIPVAVSDSPVGRQRFEIRQAEALALDETGGITLSINVSEMDHAPVAADAIGAQAAWEIESLELVVMGESLAVP